MYMYVYIYIYIYGPGMNATWRGWIDEMPRSSSCARMHLEREKEFFADNLLVRIHLIIEMILEDRPCAMGF